MKKRCVLFIFLLLLIVFSAVGEAQHFSNDEIELSGTVTDGGSVTVNKVEVDRLNCIYAYRISGISGKNTVVFKTDEDAEQLRIVRIEGKRIFNLAGAFSDGKVSFNIDTDGIYALINVDEAVPKGLRAKDFVFAVPAVCALVLCAVVLFRRRQK